MTQQGQEELQNGLHEAMIRTRRDPDLVALACRAGVPAPRVTDIRPAPAVTHPIPFIENKLYDHARLSDLLSLSIAQNHHANGGPVSHLLEDMVASLTRQSGQRRVIAVSSGTTALHMACGMHTVHADKPDFQWVTSAFNFFSAGVGPLAQTMVLDCDKQGGFDLDALRALPLDSYDGVIYTNVFAQYSRWDAVAEFCAQHDKRLVVDNATGLLDRPPAAVNSGSPIEIISAHHTKPWGVGEGGFIICDAVDEPMLRRLSNFAAPLPNHAAFAASNYKISDLSAAAIIDRLERMPAWSRLYIEQANRMHRLMMDTDLGLTPFTGTTIPCSPRAHTPFLCPVSVDVAHALGLVTLRKYYRPLPSLIPTPNADDIFARIFSLANAPEMQLATDDAIMAQIRNMIAHALQAKGDS